jgi:hypothetical protein
MPSEGYLQSKDLQQAFFSQFLVFRIGLHKIASPKVALYSGRKAILLRAFERLIKSLVIPNRAENPVRNLLSS